MEGIHVLLIGLGYHARRIYYPSLMKLRPKGLVGNVVVIDLESQKNVINDYLLKNNSTSKVYYIKDGEIDYYRLRNKHNVLLNRLVKENNISAVIISTEPLSHMPYALWASENNLNVLMDKPISTYKNISTEMSQANRLLNDYQLLNKIYSRNKLKTPNIQFTLMAQRRFHPAYIKVKTLIAEVFDRTNCPVTSIQSFHSDGQWRLPSEIIDLDYHPYNQGYGKCSHSGYHSIDIQQWFMEAAQGDDKKIDNVDIFTIFSKPADYIHQMNWDDYRGIFRNFDEYNKYSPVEFMEKVKKYGEIDAFTTLGYKQGENIISLGSINLTHNGFSQRGWVTPGGRNLYKGNGRVRHETHYISQGPFQSISIISYQSKEINPSERNDIYGVGGEYHFDVHVFRNDKLFPEWKNYNLFRAKDFGLGKLGNYSRGHQEDARFRCIKYFLNNIRLKNIRINKLSEISSHEKCVKVLYGIYKSGILKEQKRNPLVNIKFGG